MPGPCAMISKYLTAERTLPSRDWSSQVNQFQNMFKSGVSRGQYRFKSLEDVQSLLLHLRSCHVFPGMLKRRIFSPAEKAGWWTHSKMCFIGWGKGWRCGKQDFEDPLVASRWCFRSLGEDAVAAAGLGKPSGGSGDIPCPGSPGMFAIRNYRSCHW